MIRYAIAYHFIHLLGSPPKSFRWEVATDIITELKLSCSVNAITSTFDEALIDPKHDGKIK